MNSTFNSQIKDNVSSSHSAPPFKSHTNPNLQLEENRAMLCLFEEASILCLSRQRESI